VARILALLLLASAALGPARAAAQGASTTQNPQVTFATPGAKQVTLQACNATGCNTLTKTITVLDPSPGLDQATVGATTVASGSVVQLTGAGHGRPPLTFTWKILWNGPEIDLSGPSAFWNTSGLPSGPYTVSLVVQNSAGTVASLPAPVAITADSGLGFYTIAPCRAIDTRGGSALTTNSAITIPVAGIGAIACGIPATARAVAINVTVVSPTTAGLVTVYPGNYPLPPVSTLNFAAGQTRANNAVLALSSDGTGSLAAMAFLSGGGSVHLLIDVDGYFQ